MIPRRSFDVSEKPEPVADIDICFLCGVELLERNEEVRGRPVVGIVELNPDGDVREGDWECEEAFVGGRASVAIAARYWITFLVLSVFPAPDSPLHRDG